MFFNRVEKQKTRKVDSRGARATIRASSQKSGVSYDSKREPLFRHQPPRAISPDLKTARFHPKGNRRREKLREGYLTSKHFFPGGKGRYCFLLMSSPCCGTMHLLIHRGIRSCSMDIIDKRKARKKHSFFRLCCSVFAVPSHVYVLV